MSRSILGMLLAIGLIGGLGCDTVVPEQEALLVVEAFADAGEPLPVIRLRRTGSVDGPYAIDETTAVTDAEVVLVLGDQQVSYHPVADVPGAYTAGTPSLLVPAPARFRVDIAWRGRTVTAESEVPPPITIDSVNITIPSEPVDGIILDSLFIDPAQLDSLQLDSLSTGARQGLVYLVEVSVMWKNVHSSERPDSLYWIRAQLKPFLSSRPAFDDFFFRPEQLFREHTAHNAGSRYRWTGVYAVPVPSSGEPLPPHDLRIALVRSGHDYARFVSSRADPERREPVSNVSGGIGIVVGISIDSMRVRIE